MAYAGRQKIYEATIRRMVTQAMEDQEKEFAHLHENDTDEQLLSLLREQARALGHSPWPGEIIGGTVIQQRFGSWAAALARAGLPKPDTLNKSASFLRVREETERQKILYRQKKAERKALADQRRKREHQTKK